MTRNMAAMARLITIAGDVAARHGVMITCHIGQAPTVPYIDFETDDDELIKIILDEIERELRRVGNDSKETQAEAEEQDPAQEETKGQEQRPVLGDSKNADTKNTSIVRAKTPLSEVPEGLRVHYRHL